MLQWHQLYRETELYKAAVRLYTKPVFNLNKALSASIDDKTFYDFARHGLHHLESLHSSLRRQQFRFRAGRACRYNFNGKARVLYIFPWEERLVDLLLYRLLNRALRDWFSPHSYAYRDRSFGLDQCQRKVARRLATTAPLYVVKRDVVDFFASIDHPLMEAKLAEHIESGDYLWQLLSQRVQFHYQLSTHTVIAERGLPFGTAIAPLLANLYLSHLDFRLQQIPGLRFFRYADDLLLLASDRDVALEARAQLQHELEALHLRSKPSHERDLLLSPRETMDPHFAWVARFRHLGLEFRAGGGVGLSRDKTRKIRNLFRSSFRRHRRRLRKLESPIRRAELAVRLAQQTIEDGVRNVAIIDYYLRHTGDEEQLQQLDRWLAEEVLSIAAGGGHKKGWFRHLSYHRLRCMGLPSLVHRRRLIHHGHLSTPFFQWKSRHISKESRGTAVRPQSAAFSPCPVAADGKQLVGERVCL